MIYMLLNNVKEIKNNKDKLGKSAMHCKQPLRIWLIETFLIKKIDVFRYNFLSIAKKDCH